MAVGNADTHCIQGKPEIQPQKSKNGFWSYCAILVVPSQLQRHVRLILQKQRRGGMWCYPLHTTSSSSCPKESCCDGLCTPQRKTFCQPTKYPNPKVQGLFSKGLVTISQL